ncbi:DUF4136 domain-containing protein [Chitinophaga rhizophila]|uniref:DUF4136 domain-containing protein n=1 Tax=Chitinophaga rhizophila TaxID=2866212 RepID=A0ABS7G7Z6_9BACT|nr:DUF4136 domain-containing protein [Chitinophaga rhizophila]MBW8683768.1 DUF4136 domain-containing protein [Chitinophaga rhizophila]
MKKAMLVMCAALGVTLSFSSCSKDPLKDMTEEESRIYVTNYDDSVNFSSYRTFSIVDSVAVATNTNERRALTDYDKQLIQDVTRSLEARGYTRVDRAAKPDLAVNLTRIDNTYSAVYYNPGYWSGIGGYYDPFYWGFPGYGYYWPSYYQVYQQERAVSIDMVDLKNPRNNQLVAVWNAMLRGSGVWNVSNVNSMVSAVFEQSAYLKATNN